MSIALASLTARLQAAAPQRNGQPADYEQLVQDAVMQLGRDVPIVTSTAISVVPGQANYALPVDFLSLIELETMGVVGDVYLGGGGIVALPAGRSERAYIEGDVLRLETPPTYAATRTLRYAAGYALVDGVYARLTENGARLALLYAAHLALMAQAADAAGSAWKYQIGDEMVDRSQHGKAVREQADSALKQYLSAVQQLRGYGQRARGDVRGGALWAS